MVLTTSVLGGHTVKDAWHLQPQIWWKDQKLQVFAQHSAEPPTTSKRVSARRGGGNCVSPVAPLRGLSDPISASQGKY